VTKRLPSGSNASWSRVQRRADESVAASTAAPRTAESTHIADSGIPRVIAAGFVGREEEATTMTCRDGQLAVSPACFGRGYPSRTRTRVILRTSYDWYQRRRINNSRARYEIRGTTSVGGRR